MFSAVNPSRPKPFTSVVLALFVIVSFAILFNLHAQAQTSVEIARVAAEVAKTAGALPAESRHVIERLTLLRELPDGTWKTHAGDLAHGEAIHLDDSSWQQVSTPEPRHSVKAPKDAVWYRRTIEVPKTDRKSVV